ncbi:YjbA family protein [Heyndrickxia oleronia]|uniref:YjbA family protein n=1 Tax=Heyndrickxia TaxID=2837504 RepID=UPI00071753C5|nr:YjbA family protein [Heyndrickxia oleronia]MBU5211767.1 YjbA family protein [Heyndrickxia oleronia]MCM3238024.1 YjbA family protein [Heyndrickxia oleronia]MCM3452974.1 YjbA family protein [Heyndrickxia oleronia]
MLYLHDVWVNWFEGEENGYNVCHFHEWRRDDTIELLDQVPLLFVEPVLFDYIENDLSEIPSEMMNEVYQKAFLRKNHERVQLDYCFVITDGKGILAVDTIGYNIPIRKSRLIPRQEQLVYEMIGQHEPAKYAFEKEQVVKEHHILSPNPEIMQGLTRKERQLKQLLFMALDQLYSSKNAAEIRYWYTEWSPELYGEIQVMDFEDVWNRLYEDVKYGWTEKHSNLCENLIKGQAFFEKLWELEHGPKVN